ncbi:hypothetical protein FBPa1_0019 [Pseudomonas phage vB_PaeP_FBPa1]|nr:hypothetical protein FBPa1_0019 [Pseudomonas phage vB_PaeP_FBPa1]
MGRCTASTYLFFITSISLISTFLNPITCHHFPSYPIHTVSLSLLG